MKDKILEYLKGGVTFDGKWLLISTEINDEEFEIAEIMDLGGHNMFDRDKFEYECEFRVAMGQFITDAINEKIKKDARELSNSIE